MIDEYCCYRYIDGAGSIAYIGRTKNLKQRINQHKTDMIFATEPTIEFVPCKNYRDSVDMELFLIRKYRPYMNSKVLPNRYIYHNLVWTEFNT